jgi:hypothetical protein
MVTAVRILGDQVGSTAPVFLAFLAVHVLAGLIAVITGAIAALVRKGSPRHIRAGRWYYRAITVLFATATVLAALRWRQTTTCSSSARSRSPPRPSATSTGAATGLATPATSLAWASPTWPCTPRSTSTTAATCLYGAGCQRSRSGCSPQPSARRSSPAP